MPRKGSLKKRSNDPRSRVDVSGLPPLRRRGREGHRSHPGEPIIIQESAARNKLVEVAAAAKQLDRQLGGYDRDDEDHFGEAFAAAALDMRAADVDALAACAAAAEDGGDDALLEASPVEAGEIESPTVFSTAVSRRVNLEELKKIKNRHKKKRAREKKQERRKKQAEAELPPCGEIETPPAVLVALEASDRAAVSSVDDDDLAAPVLRAGLVIEEVTPEERARLSHALLAMTII